MVRIEAFLAGWHGLPGRPPCERAVLARAFIAKAVFNIPTTSLLIEMLSADKTLRRLCGWQRAGEVPSRVDVFAGFRVSSPRAALPSRLHEALIQDTSIRIVWSDISHVTARRSRRVKNRRNSDKPAAEPKTRNLSVAVPARESSRPPPPPSSGSNANGA